MLLPDSPLPIVPSERYADAWFRNSARVGRPYICIYNTLLRTIKSLRGMAASFHPRPLPFYYFGHNCTVSSLASCKLSEVYNVVSFTLNQANRLDYSESGAGGRYRTGNQRRDTEQILFCVDKLNTPVGVVRKVQMKT